jgi:hypothetical protein
MNDMTLSGRLLHEERIMQMKIIRGNDADPYLEGLLVCSGSLRW